MKPNKNMIKKAALPLLLLVPLSAEAVVCTDPTGAILAKGNLLMKVKTWAEEKIQWAKSHAQSWAIAEWEDAQAERAKSAEISAITSSVSSGTNAAAEERFAVSPSTCGTLTRLKGYANSFSDTCDSPLNDFLFESKVEKITDCGRDGSGLNCNKNEEKHEKIAGALATAIEDEDGGKLIAILNPASSFGLTGESPDPDFEEENKMAIELALGVKKPKSIPRTVNGDIVGGGRLANQQLANWAEDIAVDSIADSSLSRVVQLYSYTENVSGVKQATPMQQLKDIVDYYNSEEFIKLVTNTNDKSNLPSDWDTRTPEAKHEYIASLPTDQKIVSSEQVPRMIAEMLPTLLRINFMTLEANNNINTLDAFILKELRKR